MLSKSPIAPIRKDPVASWIRRLAKGGLGAIPVVGSVLAETYDEVMPNSEIEEQERWQSNITQLANFLQRNIGVVDVPQASVAWRIAEVVWKNDADAKGMVQTSEGAIFESVEGLTLPDAEEGLAQLINAGWIAGYSDPNSRTGIGGVHAKSLLFAFVDPVLIGTSPFDDARQIAAFALENVDVVSSTDVQSHFGWDNRQCYPALALLGEHIVPDANDARYSEEYPFAFLYLNGVTRMKLRQYVEG